MTRPTITTRRIGNDRTPVVIVDDFHPDPDVLRAFATRQEFGPALNHYPGVRAPLPLYYLQQVHAPLTAVLTQVFGATRDPEVIDASFSIVTTPAAELSLPQRVPHFDALEPGRIALVHYLAPENGDGTAFFRHRSTGLETIDQIRAPVYFAQLNAELRGGVPEGYVRDSSAAFERIAAIEARYNRAAIYPSALLHSGAISSDATLSADPRTGRLTVTAFLTVR